MYNKSDRSQLIQASEGASEVLLKADTVFPFTLFPDTIQVDRVKVTISRRSFFKVADVISLQIEDILNVEGMVGPFFGGLKIWTRFFSDKPCVITYLRREDALAIKGILQGYSIARQKEIDCSKISKQELLPMLYKLGREIQT